MDPDMIFFLKSLSEHIDRILEQHECIQCIDALIRRDRRMRSLAFEGDLFIDKAA